MKKLLALLLTAMLIVSMAACGETAAPPATTTEPTTAPAPVGTLLVTFGAAMELVYDVDGKVISITGTNELGKTIAEAKQDQLNTGCVYALRAILRYAVDNNLLGDAKNMVVRVGKGDPLPKEDFLTEICTDCQYLADEECTGIQMIQLSGDKLNEEGNLTADTAKALAVRFLGAEAAEVTGTDAPVDDLYTFTWSDKTVTVHAFTGLVTAK